MIGSFGLRSECCLLLDGPDAGALHAALREEARASFGLPQRGGRRRSPMGLTGVVRWAVADPFGFAQVEAGLTPGDLKAVIADARRLYKDGKLVAATLHRTREAWTPRG